MPLTDLNALDLGALYAALAGDGLVRRLLELARDEDLGPGGLDATSLAATDADATLSARIVAREAGVVAGLAAVPEVCQLFAPGSAYEPIARDGERVQAGDALARVRGPARGLLAAERTMLNLVGRLSGVASRTAMFVAGANAGAERAGFGRDRVGVYDTRKTTPGLRALEKYAVRCGGGMTHRLGLYDAVLVKDNHLAGVSDAELPAHVEQLARSARGERDLRFVEIEVDTLDQFRALAGALAKTGPGLVDIALLDNMDTERLREAVGVRDAHVPWLRLEASGGVTIDTIGAIAGTGVERVSVGSLTHGAVSVDVGLDAE